MGCNTDAVGHEHSWAERQGIALGGLVACVAFVVGGGLGYWLAEAIGVNGLVGYVPGVVLGYLASRQLLRWILVRQGV